MTTHDEISKRAREIWEREGRPEGRDKEHWLQAESELQQERERTGDVNFNSRAVEAAMAQPSSAGAMKEEANRKRTMRRVK
jgi:hypothetical protein